MAKSARSKSKARSRNVLRKNVFGPLEEARIQRLAEKQRVKDEEKPPEAAADAEMDAQDTTKKTAADSDSEMADADGGSRTSSKGSKNSRVSKKPLKSRNKGAMRTVHVRGKKGQITKKKVLAAFWDELQKGLDRVFESDGQFKPIDYVVLYTKISGRLDSTTDMGSASLGGACAGGSKKCGSVSSIQVTAQRGNQLYYWLTNYMTVYLQRLAKGVSGLSGIELLRFYAEEWEKYIFAAKLVKGMFWQLQKQWLAGEKRCNNNYCFVQETLEQLWYYYMFKPISSHVVRSVVSLVDEKRKGHAIEDNFILMLANAFSRLKPENTSEAYVPYRENLGVYLRFFEGPYVRAAVGHVRAKTSHLYGSENVREYISAVDRLIRTEEIYGQDFLLPESKVVLSCFLNKHFIDDKIQYIVGGLQQLFASGNKGDLQLTYKLLDRVSNLGHLQPLSRAFGEHVFNEIVRLSPAPTEVGKEGASSAETQAAYTSSFIDAILDTMDAQAQLLAECFASNEQFAGSMKEKFVKVINSDQLMDRCKSMPMKLLAEYFHLVAKASGGDARRAEASTVDPEIAIKEKLERALKLYELAKRKDDFLAHYALHLARRLLLEQSVSLELERTIVSMIGLLGSMEMTTKLKDMLMDIDTSQDMSRSFSQAVAADRSVSVSDVHIKVLKTASWPAVIQSESGEWTTPPPQLAQICSMFANAYNARHSARDQEHRGGADAKRKLRWLWEYSKCSVQFFFPHSTGRVAKTGYTFILNTFQLAILMLFTESSGLGTGYSSRKGPVFTKAQICNATNIHPEVVDAELAIFVRARILVQLAPSGAYQLNDKFNSKRLRIDISAIKRARRAKEEAKVSENTAQDRHWYLMADITRCMKAKRTMMFNELFESVVGMRTKLFEVTMKDFKNALDGVIDRGMIERSDEDERKLIYVS
ncbi:ubiquitin ligase (cullin) of SCF [Coemansia sp. RSA 2599]|nr:ubiquitin ligase (cullin) of SCF [Coemansia sp. RSA 2598]KAJ1829164.1 ubiquitin ligase (cullin) of SCF [Coemansia sp. RSA 2599]